MGNVTDAQLEVAEIRGRGMLETEPRASAAHYDAAGGRIVVDLINGCTHAFPVHLMEDLHGAPPPRRWRMCKSMGSASTCIGPRWMQTFTSQH